MEDYDLGGGLTEDDFWAGPLHGSERLADRLLQTTTRLVLRLEAPAFVPLDKRTSLPVLIAAAGPSRDVARFALEERAVLVAVEEVTGVVRIDQVVRGDSGTPGRLPPPVGFEGGLADTRTEQGAEVLRVDLAGRLGMPWPPGGYLLRVLAANHASNPRRIQVGSSGSTYDPALPSWAEMERKRRGAPQVSPPPDPQGGLPRYVATPESPAVPENLGVELVVPRVTLAREGARCVLYGAYRVPVRPERIAKPGAIVPITLVITASEDRAPIVIGLEVPSFEAVDAAGDAPRASGHFAVDLLKLAPHLLRAQTYFVYAFSGEVMSGPRSFAVVSEGVAERAISGALG